MFKLNTFFSHIMPIEPIQRQIIVSLIYQIAFTFIDFFSTMYFTHAVNDDVLGAYLLFVAYFNIIGLIINGAFVVLCSVFVTVVIVALIALRSYFVDLNSAETFT